MITQQQHTQDCQNYMKAQQKLQEDWLATYPYYCKPCFGLGQVIEHNYPFEPDWAEPCSACTEKGLCPRCGQAGLTSDPEDLGIEVGVGPCTYCGWDYDDGLPYGAECICPMEPLQAWDDTLQRQYERGPL